MAAAAVLAAIVLLLCGLFYLLYLNEQRWFELSRQSAVELGCGAAPEKVKSLMEDYEIHRWQAGAFAVELKTGTVASLAGPAGAVPVTSATASIAWPKPLPFEFRVELKRLMNGNAATGDLDFDGELSVLTGDENAARAILERSELRAELRELFQSGRSLPTASAALDEKGVSVRIFDKKRIRASLDLALSIARRISAG